MTPVDQDQFCDPDLPSEEQRGNCLQAVIASLLDLPLDEVPHFVKEHVDSGGQLHWWDQMWKWLAARGWAIHAAGLDTHRTENLMASGPSPRGNGIHHVVIYRDGEMVHDPHPDRSGILSVEDCFGLHRIDDKSVRA